MFGGIEPPCMKLFKANEYYDFNKGKKVIRIFFELPDDLTIPGEMISSGHDATICTVGGVMIRKSLNDYPKDEFDGDLFIDISADNVPKEGYVVDEDVEFGTTCYYTAFVYSTQGIYRRSSMTMGMLTPMDYFFGYDLDTNNSDPEKRVTYPEDVYNYGWNPASINNLNDWDIQPGCKFMPQPCMLKYDGTVGEYLDPNDYSKTVDGQYSNVANTSYGGNAMMRWPKIYTKRWEENGIYHFRCTDVKIDDDYECWCNYDADGNEIDYFYTGIYDSYTTDYGDRSISGLLPTTSGKSASERFDYSKQNGNGWSAERAVDHFLIQDLLVMMGKSTDTQAKFGNGRSQISNKNTGYGNSNGLFYGSKDNYSTVLKIFGMEDYWGFHRRALCDILAPNQNHSDPNTEVHVTIKGVMYEYFIPKDNDNGFISDMLTEPYGRIPYASVNGSSSTYECDLMGINAPSGIGYAYYVADIAGYSTSATTGVGAFTFNLNRSNTDWNGITAASRLSCKPIKQ